MKKFLVCFLLFCSVFFVSCDSSKKYYENAIEKFNTKDYVEAENILNNLVAKYPTSEFVEKAKEKIAEIYWNRAIEKFNNKEYIEAENILNNLVAKYPTSEFVEKAKEKIAEIYWQKAIDKFNDEYYEQARNILNDLISKFPTSKLFDIAEKKIKEIKNKAEDFYTDFDIACNWSNNQKIKQYLIGKGEDKIVEAIIVSDSGKKALEQIINGFNKTGWKLNETSASYFAIANIAFEINEKDIGYRCYYKVIEAINDNLTKGTMELFITNKLLEDKEKERAKEHLKKAIEFISDVAISTGKDITDATELFIEYIKSSKLSKKNTILQLINEIN